MRYRILTIALSLLSYPASLPAAATNTEDQGAALVGRWQPGLSAAVRKLPRSQWVHFGRGELLVQTQDHRIRIYPKCGREEREWKKHGLQYGEGEWSLTADNKLRIVIRAKGQKHEQIVDFVVDGDDLTLKSPSNPDERFGRFPDEESQRCQ